MLVRMCSKAVIAEEGFARTLEMATNLTQQSPPEGIYICTCLCGAVDVKYLYANKVYSRVISARLSSIYVLERSSSHYQRLRTCKCRTFIERKRNGNGTETVKIMERPYNGNGTGTFFGPLLYMHVYTQSLLA